jgi:methylenetetrahydrofolate--tRNA-(uracil-5-)-methyltransferase
MGDWQMRDLDTNGPAVTIIGGGLAGSEAAWQAAQRGVHVTLYEMRPVRPTPAHVTDRLAEMVCSNSLGSTLPDRPLGLLKDELRRLGSLIISCADAHALPAGSSLAVGREAFSAAVTEAITGHPNIEVRREEVTSIPTGIPVIVATGPLTSPALSEEIRRMGGRDYLYFFDAMAPIVAGDSVNMDVAFRANRWEFGGAPPPPRTRRRRGKQGRDSDAPEETETAGVVPAPADGLPGASAELAAAVDAALADGGEFDEMAVTPETMTGDYINCPMTRDEYYAFVEAVNAAEKIDLHAFEQDEAARRYFEGCLPIEVLAARDLDALAYGPMRPVGFRDPHTGHRPFAVVQLRQDNAAGTLYNLVGFQTNIKWGEQERVLRMIPGLAEAEFVRFGQMHRNTFINSPTLLRPTLQWRGRDDLFFAGQVTGTEGYVGSTAGGLLAGVNAARIARGMPPVELPPTTMMGALCHYITHAEPALFQPMKATFGLLPPLESPPHNKRERGAAYAARARDDLEAALNRQQFAA